MPAEAWAFLSGLLTGALAGAALTLILAITVVRSLASSRDDER